MNNIAKLFLLTMHGCKIRNTTSEAKPYKMINEHSLGVFFLHFFKTKSFKFSCLNMGKPFHFSVAISDVTVPWVQFDMIFSVKPWQTHPLALYTVEYLHSGVDKIW